MAKVIDITGQKFNMLTAMELVRTEKKIGSIWRFECECGNIVELPAGRVKYGTTKSCGCIKRDTDSLVGKRFAHWTVVERVYTEKGAYWLCECDCGNSRKVKADDLVSGNSTNCGCKRAEDLSGRKFGKWSVIKRDYDSKNEVRWICKCDCGSVKSVSASSLRKGTSRSCGCKNLVDFIGKRFGRLLVIEKSEPVISESGKKTQMWRCVCDCGNEINVRHSCLQSGHTTSCGCYHKETVGRLKRTHGLSHKSHLYSVWKNIKDRCYREKCKSYHNYGGRGITMCDEWKNDYKKFYDWAMKNGYEEKQTAGGVNILSIDRIDNDGNYEPQNCRWVTADIQAKNKRRK